MPLGRCPLPPDPGYEATTSYYTADTSDEVLPCGRIRPEAQDIARRHKNGIISMLLSSECIDTGPARVTRCKAKKKSHSQANKRRIREIQVRCQSRQRENERPLPPHSDKFKDITSKTNSYLQRPASVSSQVHVTSKEQTILPRPATTSSLHHDSSLKLKRNFILENISGASQHHVKQPPKQVLIKDEHEKREMKVTSHKKGLVPQYLSERKKQWKREEEERIASLPDPTIPIGHVLMPRAQRLETLSTLQQHHQELLKELQSLSLTADTLRVNTRRRLLESRLMEVEDAVKIFAKPKVFIKIDE